MSSTGQEKVHEFYRSGRLAEAIQASTAEVKQKPTDADARYTLFVLLCFNGEIERAEKQLDVIAKMDDRARTGSAIYQSLLSSEWERRQVYEHGAAPTLPHDAPQWAHSRVTALHLLQAGDAPGAEQELGQAVETTPPFVGTINGAAFSALRDDDDVLASVIEVFAGGRYLWLPMSHVRSIEFRAPETFVDHLWRQAKLCDAAGDVANVHLPALYQASYRHDEDSVRLGRRTEWVERGEVYVGYGQHVFMTVREDARCEDSILDLQSLAIEAST